ncbi:hypothetical protein HK104_007979, partial [Borealophlyctis nickersoniae]
MVQVIGAGFGRTGTTSLQAALQTLGYKTYGMSDNMTHNHSLLWLDFHNNPHRTDFDLLLSSYDAAVSWPSTAFYKRLLKVYPTAKVVLTVRDPESWYTSVRTTIWRVGRDVPWNYISEMVPRVRALKSMNNAIIWDGIFGGRFLDKEHSIRVYKEHIEEVKRTVPPDQLLVYDVKEGWEPLCRFLGKSVPVGTPMVHENTGKGFQELRQRLRWKMMGGFFALVAVLVAAFGGVAAKLLT